MCGRYTLTAPAEVLSEVFEIEEPVNWTPRYNIAPTQEAAVLGLNHQGGRSIGGMKWGLVPSWAKDPSIGNRMINARAETVAEKPAYRSSFKKRRCLLLADGFYEWKKAGSVKQPYYLSLQDHRPFAIAGIWSRWRREEQDDLLTCSLITTSPNSVAAEVHDRMPAILQAEDFNAWLDPANDDTQALLAMLGPYSGEDLQAFAVSTLVNSPKNDTPQLIERLA